MSETFDNIIKYSQRLHWLWSACDHRRGTSAQLTSYREEMRLVQWGILPKLWHLHRVDMAKLAALEEVERTTIAHNLLDDYLERAVMVTSADELSEFNGYNIITLRATRKTYTEEAATANRLKYAVPLPQINTEPHRLPLSVLHTKRGIKRDVAYTRAMTAPPPRYTQGLNTVT